MRRLLELAATSALTAVGPELLERARSWIEGDPDPRTRTELQALIDSGDTAELASRMDGSLEFGTAGIRGEVGAGQNRMNRAVVVRTTRGLVDYLIEEHGGPPDSPVVVGFDARPSSRSFAEDAIGVLAAAGIGVRYFPDVIPTPLVAFACKHLDAAAAIVITASHNPPSDNGYKVYAANGAQIIPPTDTRISDAIERVGPAAEVPRIEAAFDVESGLISTVPADILDVYWREVNAVRPAPQTSRMKIVYTPIHGVGGGVLSEMFRRAGHEGLMVVPEQATPDGTFPTVTFPNPEEKGSLDLAIAMADEVGADLVIANDPDADRFATVIPDAGSWRALSGNEVGVLLGDYVLGHHEGGVRPIVINSIVSSPMLGRIAARYGAHFERTLTGFKWISNAALSLEQAGVGEFVFGYEEALGYTIGPTVRDKDGISTALVFVDLVAGLGEEGISVLDRLAELWQMAGVWASSQLSITRPGQEGQEAIQRAIESIAGEPPREVGGLDVTAVDDYRTGAEARPPWLGVQALIELTLGERGRVLVRPSGTEPKLKIYVDLADEVRGDARAEQSELQARAHSVASGIEEMLTI